MSGERIHAWSGGAAAIRISRRTTLRPRTALFVFVLFFLRGATLSAGPVVQVEITGLGAPGTFTGMYTVSGFDFQANEELDIQFPVDLYGSLSNGNAGPGFAVMLFQPNVPPGLEGDYSALALVDNPSLSQPFTVDFTYIGTGHPGAQPFQINQFDSNGNFISTIASGTTDPDTHGPGVVAEPPVLPMTLVGIAVYGLAWVKHKHRL